MTKLTSLSTTVTDLLRPFMLNFALWICNITVSTVYRFINGTFFLTGFDLTNFSVKCFDFYENILADKYTTASNVNLVIEINKKKLLSNHFRSQRAVLKAYRWPSDVMLFGRVVVSVHISHFRSQFHF